MDKILNYLSDAEDLEDENSKQDESILKVRNIPHIEGNFDSFIYFTIEKLKYSKKFLKLKSLVEEKLLSLEFIKNRNYEELDTFHISLSSTFYLKLHQINSFLTKFKNIFKEQNNKEVPILLNLSQVKYFSNEQNTRYFISLEVQRNKTLIKLLQKIEDILKSFNISIPFLVEVSSIIIDK
jgi:hypothetical protein